MPINQPNQFLSTASVKGLVDSAAAPLTGWYAGPLTPEQADELCQAAQRAIQAQLRTGESCFQQRLSLLCCDATAPVAEARYNELLCCAANRHQRALLELVHGQWLASRKLLPAMCHLADGFRLAAPLLASEDYFQLLHRHERLAWLAFSTQPACPQDLPALLTEAAVTERLQRGMRRGTSHCHLDTLG